MADKSNENAPVSRISARGRRLGQTAADDAALARGEEMFSTREACAITGAKYQSADYWARHKILAPAIEATGRGTGRCYTFGDVLALAAIMQLHERTSLEIRQQVVEKIRKNPSARQLRVEVGKFCYLTINLASLRIQVRIAAVQRRQATICTAAPSPGSTPREPRASSNSSGGF